ncbi:Lipase (class 3) [Methylomagnum ishizawai]|uniref:Lipase (Class 3) n=1 Tax=Methylomagnum ishizawai TaxID=1760988 RepID=A0A1Y6D1B5_9GAMM|nr:hypothetical protein [Methylomagnum ishizawai]SMF94633.1 Lipase (class 3) [Methylomagnum ishizawai]
MKKANAVANKVVIILLACLASISNAESAAPECLNTMAPPKNSFDLTQTAYLFNFIANADASIRGNPQNLADFVFAAVTNGNENRPYVFVDKTGNASFKSVAPGLIKTLGPRLAGGDWELVWGPGVYELSDSNGESDNAAFVVHSASQDAYILAIAGTNPSANLDWLLEDFKVGPDYLVKWPLSFDYPPTTIPRDQVVNSDQMISTGTAKGVYYLLTSLVQSRYAPSVRLTLQAFLSRLSQSSSGNTKLIVTGHSLGGALSPTVANWAQDTLTAIDSRWAGHVFAMPTAGPTPGNAAYARSWNVKFQPCTVPVNDGNIVKSLNSLVYSQWDIVPHAWDRIFKPLATQEENYYLWDPHPIGKRYGINTQLGELSLPSNKTSKAFGAAVVAAQRLGDEAGMTSQRSKIEIKDNNARPPYAAWPVLTLDTGNFNQVVPYYMPDSPIQDLGTFFDAIGNIHTWGYTSAFGIQIQDIQDIFPLTQRIK